jgi:hypothetical protein
LAVIDDEKENRFLETHINSLRTSLTEENQMHFWIGLKDSGTKRNYVWVDSSNLVFGNKFDEGPWFPGEPNEVTKIYITQNTT